MRKYDPPANLMEIQTATEFTHPTRAFGISDGVALGEPLEPPELFHGLRETTCPLATR